jgi:hypothetical protein
MPIDPDILALVELPKDDASYLAWVQQHLNGWVINANRTGNWPMYWHRADCSMLTTSRESKDAEGVYLGPNNVKACSLHPGALAMWAKSQPDELDYCSFCRNKVSREIGQP